jgi:hypothetical protein
MPATAQVLAAIQPSALLTLRRAIGRHVGLVPCHTFDEAKARLARGGIDLVLCGLYFDESRMLDLLHHVRGTLPFLSCRLLSLDRPTVSLEALRLACENLGAVFLDLPALRQQHGAEGAEARLAERVLGLIGGDQRRSRPRL